MARERAEPGALGLAQRLAAERTSLHVPAAAWIEFLAGFAPPRRPAAVRRLEGACSFIPLDREIADEAARLQHELAREGRTLAWHDLQVAATAARLQDPLVTRDERLRAVPGLELIRF